MKTRKSNWKWALFVLNIIAATVNNNTPLGFLVYGFIDDVIIGGATLFLIGWAIDAYRERRWRKQDEITEMRRDLNHQAKELKEVKKALSDSEERNRDERRKV